MKKKKHLAQQISSGVKIDKEGKRYESLLETIPCNLCGFDDNNMEILYREDSIKRPSTKEDFIRLYSSSSSAVFYERLVRCRRCGLIFISPRLKSDLIVQGYSSSQDKDYISQEKGRRITFTKSVKIVKSFSKKGKLLDIGAASGIFVKVARDAGYDARGVEPAGWMCKMARDRYSVDIFPGVLKQANFEDRAFDIITMWDVLEHVSDPMATLIEVNRILKPGGLLFINYPCISDPFAKLFGRKWWFLLSVHLFYFTPKTLSSYMEKTGFKKIVHRPHFQVLAYDYLVQRLNVYSKFLAKVAKIPCLIPGFKDILIPYFASQYLLVSRKKD
ncbi:MAG: class I SAM-dependent methyltransferase [Candidatus Omnitrophota bacterium]